MKKWMIVMSACILFVSCSKEDIGAISQDDNSATITTKSSGKDFIASPWEQFSAWSYTDSSGYRTYFATRKNADITGSMLGDGVVMTYAMVDMDNPRYSLFKTPTLMPFHFMPYAERPINSVYWYDEAGDGTIKVSFRTMSKEEMPSGVPLNDFRFRYFVISKDFLDRHHLTASTVKNYYNYKQVATLLGVSE